MTKRAFMLETDLQDGARLLASRELQRIQSFGVNCRRETESHTEGCHRAYSALWILKHLPSLQMMTLDILLPLNNKTLPLPRT